ncbi:aryl-alcohol dehydrogenase [Lactarius deliciosus]|nr:aryl-alcohol dehydrogenase [Lactarius deliciosus]
MDPMAYRGVALIFRPGKSRLKVSRIIFNMISYGEPRWEQWILGGKEGIEHVKIAYERGVYLGNAIKAFNLPREEVVVMTKVYIDVNNFSKLFLAVGKIGDEHIFDSVKKSLERLQLDYIDVLQCHRFDPSTPIEETMQALHDIVKAGYVRYIGMIQVMQSEYAITNNLTPFISTQNHHSLVYREEEHEMFPTLNHFGVGIIPWSPLARGLLTRPFKTDGVTKRGNTDLSVSRYPEGAISRELQMVEEISRRRWISMAQVPLAWSLTHVTAPVIGSISIKNLEELIKEIQYLEEPYKARSVMGHA